MPCRGRGVTYQELMKQSVDKEFNMHTHSMHMLCLETHWDLRRVS